MNVICSGSAATRGLWLDANIIMTAVFGMNPPDGRSEYCVPLCTAAVLHIHSPKRLDVIACDLLTTPISRNSGALGWPFFKPWLEHDRALHSLCVAISASDFTYLPLQLFFSFDLRGLSPHNNGKTIHRMLCAQDSDKKNMGEMQLSMSSCCQRWNGDIRNIFSL